MPENELVGVEGVGVFARLCKRVKEEEEEKKGKKRKKIDRMGVKKKMYAENWKCDRLAIFYSRKYDIS